jgi:hypothetical protein
MRHIDLCKAPSTGGGVSIHTNGAEKDKSPYTCRSGLSREVQRPIGIYSAEFRKRISGITQDVHARSEMDNCVNTMDCIAPVCISMEVSDHNAS